MRLRVVAALAASAVVVPTAAAAPSSADRASAERGASWLASQSGRVDGGPLADLIVSLRQTGTARRELRGRVRALARDGRSYGRGAGRAAKVARAALAVGADPRRFGRVDYLARIDGDYRRGRYGRNAFDHALAIIVLREAGRPVPRAALRTIARSRGQGGWGLAMTRSAPDDVDATAVLIEAMRAAGVGRNNRALRAARSWLLRQRRAGGAYPSRPGRPADANSTAAALRALVAMRDRRAPTTARALRSFQRRDGHFTWQAARPGSPLLATIDAVGALTYRG